LEPRPVDSAPIERPRAAGALRARDRLRRAGLTSVAIIGSRAIGAVTTIISVPLTLSYLGTERYGLWMTISSLIAFLAFTDLGIGNGLLTAIAHAHGRKDREATMRYAASGVWALAAVAAAIVIGLAATYPFISWADLFNISDPRARAESAPAMLAFGWCFALSLPLSAVSQIRYGLQEGYLNSAFVAAGNLLALAALLAVIGLRLGLPVLVVALMGAPLLTGLLNAGLLFGRQRPWLTPRIERVDGPTVSVLLRSGWQFLVLQLAMAAAFYSDSLIAARIIGPTAVAEYAVAVRLFLIPTILVTAGLSPLWPAYGEAIARGDIEWIRVTLRRSLALAILITLPLSVLLALAAEPILYVWIGEAVRPPPALIAGMAAWTVLNAIGTAVAMYLNGLHLLRVQVVTAVVMAVLNVTLSVVLAMRIGVAGVILGTVIAYPLSTLIPLLVYLPRTLRRLGPATREGVETHGIG
jgi:O-antigen/teichoic acid export membrane protein